MPETAKKEGCTDIADQLVNFSYGDGIDDVWLMIPGYKSKMSNEDNLRFKKIHPIEIKENIKHIFDSRSSKNALGFGWTHSTQKGIWTEGSELNMLFYFKPILDKDYQLRLKVNSSYTNANNNLAGSIYLNSKKIKNFEFQNFKNSEDTFIDILLSDNHSSNNVYKIDIKIDNPVSPLELLKSADARKLGLLIESLEIN